MDREFKQQNKQAGRRKSIEQSKEESLFKQKGSSQKSKIISEDLAKEEKLMTRMFGLDCGLVIGSNGVAPY